MLCDWHSFVKSRFQSSAIVLVVWIAGGGWMIRIKKDDATMPTKHYISYLIIPICHKSCLANGEAKSDDY